MEILKRVIRKSIFIILPAVIISFFYEAQKLPLGIFLGWLFGIVNLRTLSRNVEGLVGTEKATAKIVISSMFRLLALFAVIFFLIYYKVVNVFGLLFGFTVVFILILIEGAKVGKGN